MEYLLNLITTVNGLTYEKRGNLIVLSEQTYGFKHAYYVATRFGRQELHREILRLQVKYKGY